jgi:Holliday junction resolvasome RuvABC endonuclease subunit
MTMSPPTSSTLILEMVAKTGQALPWAMGHPHRPVIGLDLSLTSTGVCVLYRGHMKTWTYGQPKPKSKLLRLEFHRQELASLLLRYSPALVGIEGHSFGSTSSAHSLGELHGVVKLELLHFGVAACIVPPTNAKMFVAQNGGVGKDQIPLHLFKRFGVEVTNTDEADATAVALTTMAAAYPHLRSGWSMTQKMTQAIEKVEVLIKPSPTVRSRTVLPPACAS